MWVGRVVTVLGMDFEKGGEGGLTANASVEFAQGEILSGHVLITGNHQDLFV